MTGEKTQGVLTLPRMSGRSRPDTGSSTTAAERWLLRGLHAMLGRPAISFMLWDGYHVPEGSPATVPVATMRIADRRTLWRLLANPALSFGDDYSNGLIEIDGSLVELVEALLRAVYVTGKGGLRERLAVNRPIWRRRNSLAESRDNIHHHYDLGNDFYRLWLDEEMVYTCAYFADPTMTLEAAQIAKMDHVCRKLQLRPGETVVEAGCGWGALSLHMARRYGAKVTAFNISREQIEHARTRARREGLDSLVTFVEDDYRNISGTYDVFVSVGMLEHVGRDFHTEFGRVIDRSLGAEGRGLVHSIAQWRSFPVNAWLERRIFPGSYPPTLREMSAILEPIHCTVTDVENLRQHYALTLRHWLARFEEHAGEVGARYGEAFVRAWRLYLSGSIANFNVNCLALYQMLFTRVARTQTPWTRAYLYASDPARPAN
jgi:cyclopropane-fatty-acyl-phospholipid synthase